MSFDKTADENEVIEISLEDLEEEEILEIDFDDLSPENEIRNKSFNKEPDKRITKKFGNSPDLLYLVNEQIKSENLLAAVKIMESYFEKIINNLKRDYNPHYMGSHFEFLQYLEKNYFLHESVLSDLHKARILRNEFAHSENLNFEKDKVIQLYNLLSEIQNELP